MWKKKPVDNDLTLKAIIDGDNAEQNSNTIFAILAQNYLKERKLARLFKYFILFVIIIYIGVMVYTTNDLLSDESGGTSGKDGFVARVFLTDIIAYGGSGSTGNPNNVNRHLRRAFESKAKGIVLRANSPGGSPVASSRIALEIKRLRELYPEKKIYTVVDSVCASGCYYVASQTDGIYADASSIVGSIGVVMEGFGFVDALKKLGMERRVLVAGDNKRMDDPFEPENEEAKQHLQGLIDEVHLEFINAVKSGRKDKLDLNNKDIFSGMYWNGISAKKLGLIDGFGDERLIAQNKFQTQKYIDFKNKEYFFEDFADFIEYKITKLFLTSQQNKITTKF